MPACERSANVGADGAFDKDLGSDGLPRSPYAGELVPPGWIEQPTPGLGMMDADLPERAGAVRWPAWSVGRPRACLDATVVVNERGGGAVPDVLSSACGATVRTWVALDVHKDSIAAGILSAQVDHAEIVQFDNTERAIRRFLGRLGNPAGLAVCYEAGPCGYDLYRLLTRAGIACDIIAPSLTPVRPGDRVKTDRRDAAKLVGLYRAGELTFVCPPTPAKGGPA